MIKKMRKNVFMTLCNDVDTDDIGVFTRICNIDKRINRMSLVELIKIYLLSKKG